jgi:tetratricopeptide (TPR) repeat protein
MRRIKLLTLLTCILFSTVLTAYSQSWTKKAGKAVFALKTFTADGTLLASGNGFFTNTTGEAVSNFTPFRGASRAVVIDAQGKEWPVDCLLGANDTYDVAKFRVAAKKTVPLSIAAGSASEGSRVWLLPYRENRSCPEGAVRKSERFMGDYNYYTIALTTDETHAGCPLLNSDGEVVGLMQVAAKAGDTLSYAVSARFADSLRITGLSINDATLRSTTIKKDIPNDLSQAQLMLFVAASGTDSVTYAGLVDDFIAKFPSEPDGYVYRAQLLAGQRRFDSASQDMEQALKVSAKPDETHFNYSKLIYQKEIYMSDAPYDGWSLDKALDEARQAEQINPLDVYRHQQALILYAQKKFREAYDIYCRLFQGDLRSAELFYEAMACQKQLGDTTAVMALLDSCVATFSRPYLKEAAPYLLTRASTAMDYGRYRQAVSDLNEYEQLMAASVNDQFYYLRYRACLNSRQYQLALNDIDKAITMAPRNDLYYSEKASLQVRVGLYDEAMETARQCIAIAPDHSDGYLFLGLAQCLKGQKAEGVKNLEKAKDLGDEQATGLIEQYGK